MPCEVTFHPLRENANSVGYGNPGVSPALFPQTGDVVVIPVGAAAPTPAVAEASIARIVSDVNCRVAVGSNAVATAANSTKVIANFPFEIYAPFGSRVSVIAA